jgi:hypothetical protein
MITRSWLYSFTDDSENMLFKPEIDNFLGIFRNSALENLIFISGYKTPSALNSALRSSRFFRMNPVAIVAGFARSRQPQYTR